jgi:hypothetical protein
VTPQKRRERKEIGEEKKKKPNPNDSLWRSPGLPPLNDTRMSTLLTPLARVFIRREIALHLTITASAIRSFHIWKVTEKDNSMRISGTE